MDKFCLLHTITSRDVFDLITYLIVGIYLKKLQNFHGRIEPKSLGFFVISRVMLASKLFSLSHCDQAKYMSMTLRKEE